MISAGFTISVMMDETAPGVEWPTAAHPSAVAAPEPLAYSETIELPDPRRSRIPVALFAAAVLAVTAAGTAWFVLRTPAATHISGPTSPSNVAATPTIAPDAAPTGVPPIVDGPAINTEAAPVPAPVDRDAEYIGKLTVSGIVIGNRDAAIGLAHQICFSFSQGMRYDTLLSGVIAESKSLTPHDIATLITAAVHIYCPQYTSQIGG